MSKEGFTFGPKTEAAASAPQKHIESPSSILRLPREERKGALTQFKAELHARQEAQASLRTEIESYLESNPDAPKDKVMEFLEHAPAHVLPEEHKQLAEEFLDRYYATRKEALDVRARFPDDKDLLAYLTNKNQAPFTDLTVKMGLTAIEIYTSSKNINGLLAEFYGKGDEISRAGGFAGSGPNGVQYSLIDRFAWDRGKIATHEQQHQTNKIFNETFDSGDINYGGYGGYLLSRYAGSTDLDEKKSFLEMYFKLTREHAYDRLKDELFAMLTDKRSAKEIESLIKPNTGVEAYDYLKKAREAHPEDPLWNEVSDKMLIKEYSRAAHSAIQVLTGLTRYYSVQEIIALLTPVPLEDWTKTAARIYQEKLSNPGIKAAEVLKTQEELAKPPVKEKKPDNVLKSHAREYQGSYSGPSPSIKSKNEEGGGFFSEFFGGFFSIFKNVIQDIWNGKPGSGQKSGGSRGGAKKAGH